MASIVTCFHGTTRDSALSILDGGFRPSCNPEDWLGRGIYFFEGSERLGWVYARKAVKRAQAAGLTAEPALFAADIELARCIDLCDPGWSSRIRAVADRLARDGLLERQHGLRLATAAGKTMVLADYDMEPDTFRKNLSDCRVIDALWVSTAAREFEPQSVRAPFAFGKQNCLNSFFFDQSHIQISVSDVSVIHDLRLV